MSLTHIDKEGNVKMVSVSEKSITHRKAIAEGTILLSPEVIDIIKNGQGKKGDVLTTAKIAAIFAAKNTANLIPLCHTIPLNGVDVEFSVFSEGIHITAVCEAEWRTGVEMEALCAVSAAALTIYDMIKAVDKTPVITDIKLSFKEGGKSGRFIRV